MLSRALGFGLNGVEGFPVTVEVNLSAGKPRFDIVGLPDASVRESQDRVRSAVQNMGYKMPVSWITVNLAPADVKKEGPCFDLPIALCILSASRQVHLRELDRILLMGELSLDGTIMPVTGALPRAIAAKEQGIACVLCSRDNAKEIQCIEGLTVYPCRTLKEAVEHLSGLCPILPQIQVSYEEIMTRPQTGAVDLCQVKGQTNAKKALEVAAAGGHNMLMVGVPGSGKTMLARCLPGILPSMSFEEALEVTRIHSAAGVLESGSGLLTTRPFRSPHHSASMASMIGGGANARPGEVSLSHNGVLFLDELPEFSRPTLEAMRQPLEDGFVTVSRVQQTARYQARCMLIASMNPCPCGYYGSQTRPCRCTQHDIRRYLDRISGPLLDRIDIQIEVDALNVEDIQSAAPAETSATVRERVEKARMLQRERYRDDGIFCNAQLTNTLIEKYCVLDASSAAILAAAQKKLNMSMRAYTRTLKVARTLADLRGAAQIGPQDIAIAVSFRALDSKYWG